MKINRVLELDAEIVRVNTRTQLHFLHGRGVLVLARFLFLFGKFVAVFANLDEAADRRHGVRGNFHQVHAVLAREREGVVQRKHAELLVVVADDADIAGADFPVHAQMRSGGRVALGLKRAAQAALSVWD